MTLEIKQLAECPEFLVPVGTWIYEEWWRTPNNTPEVVFSKLRGHCQKDAIPFTVVVVEAGRPVGSCCVIENDCIHRPQYSPWVAAVYVRPEYRLRGIASRILQESFKIAQRIGVAGLYIDCHCKTRRVYEKNGWRILEREVGDRDSVVLWQSTTSTQGRGANALPRVAHD